MSVLNDSVLILNKHLLAIQVTNVRDAIIALVAERARVIDHEYRQFTFKEWADASKIIEQTDEKRLYSGVLHSPSTTIVAPQVIVATECEYFESTIRNIRYSRRNVFQRDNFTCQYCGQRPPKDQLTVDHIVPRSRGGKNVWANVVTCCLTCNATKGNQTIEELEWKLLSKPATPRWKSHIGRPFNTEKKSYWERFLK